MLPTLELTKDGSIDALQVGTRSIASVLSPQLAESSCVKRHYFTFTLRTTVILALLVIDLRVTMLL
jgi:hypothetical protein